VLSGETTNTNFIVFGLIRSGLEPTIYCTRGELSNYYTTDAVLIRRWRKLFSSLSPHKKYIANWRSDKQEILHRQYGHIIEKIGEVTKGQSEAVNRRRTDNTMTKGKGTKRQHITKKYKDRANTNTTNRLSLFKKAKQCHTLIFSTHWSKIWYVHMDTLR